jgi:quercetin dioxygenase-like cupin family protein
MSEMNWDELEWESVLPGVKRKVFHANHCTLVYNVLEVGSRFAPHSHPHEQVVYILHGEGEFVIGGRRCQLGPGSVMTIAPGVEHSATIVGAAPCINLDVFVPRREDYRPSKRKS